METHEAMTQLVQSLFKPRFNIKERVIQIKSQDINSFRSMFSIDTLLICILVIMMINLAIFFRPIRRASKEKLTKITSEYKITAHCLIIKF